MPYTAYFLYSINHLNRAGTVTPFHRWANKPAKLNDPNPPLSYPALPSDSAFQKATLCVNNQSLSWHYVVKG